MTRARWATGLFVTAALLIAGMIAFSSVVYVKFAVPDDKRVWLVPHLVRHGAIDGAKWNEQINTFNRLLRLDARGRLDEAHAQHNIGVIANWVAPRPPVRIAAGVVCLGILALALMFFAALAALNRQRRWERTCLLGALTLLILSIPLMFIASFAVGGSAVKDRARAGILVACKVVRGDQWNKVAAEFASELPKWPVPTPTLLDPEGTDAEWKQIDVLQEHLSKVDTTSQAPLTGAFWCAVGGLVLVSAVLMLRRTRVFADDTADQGVRTEAASMHSPSEDVTSLGTTGGNQDRGQE